jgi:hypothetical protein
MRSRSWEIEQWLELDYGSVSSRKRKLLSVKLFRDSQSEGSSVQEKRRSSEETAYCSH